MEPWSDRRDASFRGVTFLLDTLRGKTGRRAIAHDYPKRDIGWAEDNGGVLNSETIKAKLVGPDAERQFEQLLNALNMPGPGELVHPYWGIRQVQIGEVDYEWDNNERDLCVLSFQVFAATDNLFPADKPDTANLMSEQAKAAADANTAFFTDQMGVPDSSTLQTLGQTLNGMLADLDSLVNGLPGLPDALADWVDRLDHLKWSVSRLVAYPGELANELTNLIFDIKDLVTEMPLALNVYSQVEYKWRGLREELNPTLSNSSTASQREKQTAQTKAAMYDMAQTATVTASVNALAGGTLTSVQQAETIGQSLSHSLTDYAVLAVDAGNRAGWRILRQLRITVAADIRERSRQLPRMKQVTPNRPMPVALLAYQHTGNAANRDDIVKRNRLSRPSFVTDTVEILEERNG
ncbi:DNA circularization protein [Photobacterium arenosum]|uniref:DNA circularization protein n=1 Tax=Photobacterium arenosum TaxID=2774143 RepID=UPI0028899AE8|nr:DNA circularization N-terminal domain-containing protein [Photobacterium arenosum]